MFFIIAENLAPLGEYINKNFGNIFKLNRVKFAPIMPIHDIESYHVITSCVYSTQEELDALV